MNQPPRPGNKPCNNHIINRPGHPSFKRRGNFYNPFISNSTLSWTVMPSKGEFKAACLFKEVYLFYKGLYNNCLARRPINDPVTSCGSRDHKCLCIVELPGQPVFSFYRDASSFDKTQNMAFILSLNLNFIYKVKPLNVI